ncbi:MAG: biopolymer transporter ExbD [Deltaproteobacteria bacterium]|nr:biopolymer transporter ExbD [Deltaproteobacteria bacterium]
MATKINVEEMERAREQRRADRRVVLALRRRFDGVEINYLNITPMLDMMTILLVFLILNFTASSTNVNLSDQLALPGSTTSEPPKESTAISVTKTAILVEDEPVVPVVRGTIEASHKRGGDTGFVILPLLAALSKQSERMRKLAAAKDSAFEPEAIIVADKTTPYRLLNEVFYTSGEAKFAKFRLVVLDRKN